MRIAKAREDAGLNQSELARKIGVTRSAISQMEGGQTKPSAENLDRLADTLQVRTKWLLHGTPPMRAAISDARWAEILGDKPDTSETSVLSRIIDELVGKRLIAADKISNTARILDEIRESAAEYGKGLSDLEREYLQVTNQAIPHMSEDEIRREISIKRDKMELGLLRNKGGTNSG